MDDTTRERLLDARIMRRLSTDAAYRNAENAEEQSKREAEITREEEQRLERIAASSPREILNETTARLIAEGAEIIEEQR